MASPVRSTVPDLSVATRIWMPEKYFDTLKQSSPFTLWLSGFRTMHAKIQ